MGSWKKGRDGDVPAHRTKRNRAGPAGDREYLAAAEQEGVVLDISGEIPKSFLVCDHPYHRQIVYLSQLNAATLQKRAENTELDF